MAVRETPSSRLTGGQQAALAAMDPAAGFSCTAITRRPQAPALQNCSFSMWLVVLLSMPRLSLNSFREEAIALVAGLAVFAVYYPLAVWVHRDFVSTGRPEGKLVELILKFEESADGGYQAQVYGSSSYQKGILYEDLTRLEEVEIRELPSRPPSWRFIKMVPRDGSDPRSNGRHYYLVQP
jgi:hypothetical protein